MLAAVIQLKLTISTKVNHHIVINFYSYIIICHNNLHLIGKILLIPNVKLLIIVNLASSI